MLARFEFLRAAAREQAPLVDEGELVGHRSRARDVVRDENDRRALAFLQAEKQIVDILDLDIGYGQGHLFGEPMSAEDAGAVLRRRYLRADAFAATKPDRTLPYDAMSAYYLSLGIDDLDLQDDKQVSVWFYDDYARELDAAGYLAAYRAAIWDRSSAKVFDFPAPAEWHPDAWVGRKAVERIASAPAETPLFTWVSFSGPHFPFDAPAEYLARVAEEHVVRERKEAEDEHLGQQAEIERRVVRVERRRRQDRGREQEALHSSEIPSWPNSPRGRTRSTSAMAR